MRGSWIAISAARARAHALYGVRGWLIALLWLNTLPVLGLVFAMIVIVVTGGVSAKTLLAWSWLAWLLVPLGLVAVAFMRVRWFPMLWFAYCALQLSSAVYMGFAMRHGFAQASAHAPSALGAVLLLALQMLVPIVTMAYIVRSRRVRVTYRHEVCASDSAAVPAAFDRPTCNETATDATDHARERAALRRVTQELSSGVLDTQTWMHVLRDHATATDSLRTAAYVRSRMAVLCPPAHVHPPLLRTLASGFGALLVALAVAMLLAAAAIVLVFRLPSGEAARVVGLMVAVLLLSWLAGLSVGARFLRRIA